MKSKLYVLLALTLSSNAWACLDQLWIPTLTTINLGPVQVGRAFTFVVAGNQTDYNGSGFPVVLRVVATGPITINSSSSQFPFSGNSASDPITINATPTAAGAQSAKIVFNFACGSFPLADPRSVTVNYNAGSALQITTNSPLPTGRAGQSYGPVRFAASGGTTPYRNWRVGTGAVPGLTLNPSTGDFTGQPTSGGAFNLTVAVDDSGNPSLSTTKNFGLTIETAPLQITTVSRLPDVVAGQRYTADLAASGGAGGNKNWMFVGIPVPGLQIDGNTGRITGPVDRPGQYVFTVRMEDQSKTTAFKQFTLVVLDPNQPGKKSFPPTYLAEGTNSDDYSGAMDSNPPQPDIAAGPDDILTVVNRTIARYGNPNAPGGPGFAPSPLNAAVGVPSEKTDLSNFIGNDALQQLCPTTPRTAASCVIGNSTVRYDQMQGRFVVLFTVTDTGLTQVDAPPSPPVVTSPRKASWVLAVSRFAALNIGGPAFVSPTAGGTALGDDTKWTVWYGQGQGFGGGTDSGSQDPGNINGSPGIEGSAASFDCTAASKERVCYFPTSARLGIDNDNITIVSSVINANAAFDPTIPSGEGGNTAFAGTRLRVIKKASLYNGQAFLAGNQFATTEEQRASGDYYDLFSNNGGAPIVGFPFTVTDVQTPTTPLFYEPAQLRGRAQASYSNDPLGGATYLLGAVSSLNPQDSLNIQTIQYSRAGPAPFYYYPGLTSSTVRVPTFFNPPGVSQAGQNTPFLYVGDSRPHRVISREGDLYVARTIGLDGSALNGTRQSTTVAYDIIRKLSPQAAATPVLNTTFYAANAYAPMFDIPANVVAPAVSPINVLPYLEKLFVGSTYPPLTNIDPQSLRAPAPNGDPRYQQSQNGAVIPGLNGQDICGGASSVPAWPGLFDIRCGEDAYDRATPVLNPATGALFTVNGRPGGQPQLLVPFGLGGGGSTDPNDGSLWLYGQYARNRSTAGPGFGQWGTYLANYPLSFPVTQSFDDVPNTLPFYLPIQVARQLDIATSDLTIGPNSFGPGKPVSRIEMARWTVKSQMDEAAITAYLDATGGCITSFADVNPPSCAGNNVTNTTGVGDWRYIETMYRRGYTKGCGPAADGTPKFCPNDTLTRGELAVFLIRAKFGNVFPNSLNACPSGIPVCGKSGDNFGQFVSPIPYFTDVQTTDENFLYIQKMRELRITNGTGGVFGGNEPVTRGEMATWLVRAFFP